MAMLGLPVFQIVQMAPIIPILPDAIWAAQQWGSAQLGDRRLTRRAVTTGMGMVAHPDASLPRQMESPKALKGAYRLLNHPEVTLGTLTAEHCQQTRQAAGRMALVLMVEDTTELDYSAHPHTQGLGPVGNGGEHAQGLLVHTTLAIVPGPDPEVNIRTLLGVAAVQAVRRIAHPAGSHAHGWKRSPEGQLWTQSAQQVGAPPPGVIWIHVSDRDSDSYEYMATCRALHKHFLLRGCKNRYLDCSSPNAPHAPDAQLQRLMDYARSLPAQPGSEYRLTLPARPDQPARTATLVMAWAPIQIPPPRTAPKVVRQHGVLSAWILRAWEPTPPAGVEAVEWVLITSLPVDSLVAARRCTAWYTCRWFCEDFHTCLKTGCQVERSQLDSGDDIMRLLGFAVPIAVRLLQLREVTHQSPDALATEHVEPLMVRLLAQRQRLTTPWQQMAVDQFWRGVAQLGGHQGRRRDGAPGWRTVWRGWQRLSDWAEGARLLAAPDTS